jgi:hypothetical protein
MEKSKANSSNSAGTSKKNLSASTSGQQLFHITNSSLKKLNVKKLEEFAKFLLSPMGVMFVSTLSGDDRRRLLHDFRTKYNSHQDYTDSMTRAHQDARDARRSKCAKMNDAAEAVSFLEKLLAQKKSEHAEAAAAVAALTVQAEKAEGLKADAFEDDANLKSAIDLLRKHIGGL